MKRHQVTALGVLLWLGSAAPIAQADFESPASTAPQPGFEQARAWELSARVFFGYNDNVQLVPDATFFTGDESDSFAGVALTGSYRLFDSEDWTLTLFGDLSQILYLGNPAGGGGTTDDYDLNVFSPGVAVQHRHQLFGFDAVGQFAYTYRHEEGRDVAAIGLDAHSFAFSEALLLEPGTTLTLGLVYGVDRYGVTFATPATDDRDAERIAVSAELKHRWANNRRNVSVRMDFTHHDADGSNFDYDSVGITGRFETHLIGPLWGAAQAGFTYSDYDGFVSGFIPAPGRTRQDIVRLGFELIYVIDARWSIDFAYTYERYGSNQAQFEADVNAVTLGLTYQF